jgi:hypothetical protein
MRDRDRGTKIANRKQRGEWAEMKFMTAAAEHGLPVSKPWGDSASYDVVVGRPGHFVAVQVKCTIARTANRVGYVCSTCSSHKKYRRGSFDFLAAYVVKEDVWYIIPEKEVRGNWSISLLTECKEARYEKYREAWHLLREPVFAGDIQACAEEFPMLPDERDRNEADDACRLGALVEFSRSLAPDMMVVGD